MIVMRVMGLVVWNWDNSVEIGPNLGGDREFGFM